ncbi:hypothetical protein L9F63_012869 [Diploptera punctata]|uniref:Uncharacterized protein n=1 Tax=Diploptera punctata TaxID=6984 RepID=A0AAD8EMV2_DIPPU|nr:hypothetical protein L9F63_012869 [Diploptera punctata]
MVRSRAQTQQVQTFGTYGAALADNTQQHQQLYQTPVQGLRLQFSNPAALNLLQQAGQQQSAPSNFNQKYFLQIRVKPTADRNLKYEAHVVPFRVPPTSKPDADVTSSSFTLSQPSHQNALPQQYQQQLTYPQQYEQQYQQQTLPQQYQQQQYQQQQYQQPQFPESVLTSAAQFRNSLSQQPVRFRAPAPVTQTTSDAASASTSAKTAAVPGLLGVAFSPASEVSQLRFSGSFANFSY